MVIQILRTKKELVHDNLETHCFCMPKMKLPAMFSGAEKYGHTNTPDYAGIGT